jgi:hypothetical protein
MTAPKSLRMFGQEIPWREHKTDPSWYLPPGEEWPFFVSVHKANSEEEALAFVAVHFRPFGQLTWHCRAKEPSVALAKTVRQIRRDFKKVAPYFRFAAELAGA